jgi:predicted permease
MNLEKVFYSMPYVLLSISIPCGLILLGVSMYKVFSGL